jgi:hypothetical protein
VIERLRRERVLREPEAAMEQSRSARWVAAILWSEEAAFTAELSRNETGARDIDDMDIVTYVQLPSSLEGAFGYPRA